MMSAFFFDNARGDVEATNPNPKRKRGTMNPSLTLRVEKVQSYDFAIVTEADLSNLDRGCDNLGWSIRQPSVFMSFFEGGIA
jgi:hypothetical protein